MAKLGEPETWYRARHTYVTQGGALGVGDPGGYLYKTPEKAAECRSHNGDYFIEEVTIRRPRG